MHATRRILTRVVNADDDSVSWVEVEPEVARVLARPEPKLKERLLRKAESVEKIAEARARYWGGSANAWEGPRLGFAWLVGESPTWSGPESVWLWDSERAAWVCRFCSHLERLPAVAYCLGCDRSGRDRAIGEPTGADLGKRAAERGRVYAPPVGIKGGTG
jgi:hypothetical protein